MQLKKYFEPKIEIKYKDKNFKGTDQEFLYLLENSVTVYVGNINTNTPEESIWYLFGFCGEIRRVIMGVNNITLLPCGFCFVEFYNKEDARKARFLNEYCLYGNVLSVDLDYGFKEGRQFGRGMYGGVFKKDARNKGGNRRYYQDDYNKRIKND